MQSWCLVIASVVLLFSAYCVRFVEGEGEGDCRVGETMRSAVKRIKPLGPGPFETPDPFLFCVYHKDLYPAGNEKYQVPGRIGNGNDFNPSAPYRMYHGERIPGFPRHPHRGFETITAMVDGVISHADSLGNGGTIGYGDVAWMTAGKGIVHGEMFPLIHQDKENFNKFFQIWLNLPKKSKMVDPEYTMHWEGEALTQWKSSDNLATVTVWAGKFNGVVAKGAPPKHSYAVDPSKDVGVFYLDLKKGAKVEIDPCDSGAKCNRFLYMTEGRTATVGGQTVTLKSQATLVELDGSKPVTIEASSDDAEFLILQGQPIGEPIAQYGPFVMNTDEEIQQAFADYRRTQFGGWPWDEDAVVFPKEKGKFVLVKGKEYKPAKNDLR